MPVQMTIIGLGQIGASIGLGLAAQHETIERVGHDINLETARQAQRLGAVDAVRINLPSAVEKADVVILAVPFDQVEETLKFIALDLKPDSVVLDTSPLKQLTIGWAKDILPAHAHYLGFVPALSPRYLLSSDAGIGGAHANLFEKGLFAIVHSPGLPSAAIQLATDLAGMLGAEYMFMEALELDSQMASLHLLPQMAAGALLNMTIDQPGWREGRKMASRPYAWMAQNAPMLESAQALASAAVHNQANLLRILDSLIAHLTGLRKLIEAGDQVKLKTYLQTAIDAQERWWKERTAGSWANEELTPPGQAPASANWLSRLIGIQPRSKKN